MKRSEIIRKTAPCSLMCYTCSAFNKGIICESAKTLSQYLNGIGEFYKEHWISVAEKYNIFEDILNLYKRASCSGCRSAKYNANNIKGCFVLECANSHKVDFCGECDEFPCQKAKDLFEKEVYLQWLDGNTQIKNEGIEVFWENNFKKPHYKVYKKKI